MNGQSTNARIDERNRLAAAVMNRERIAIDDQHGLMVKHPEMYNGDVHFTEAGSALQAVQAAATIREAMATRIPPLPQEQRRGKDGAPTLQ
jgi:hypothetical protein